MSSGGQTTQTPAPLSPQELEFISTQNELAQFQLQNLEGLQPFQKALLKDALTQIGSDRNYDKILNHLITPKERALAESEDFDRARQFGTRLDNLQQMQMADLQAGSAENQAQMDRIRSLTDTIGTLTPEQEARIRAAADASIASGSYDIDQQTKQGLGLIEDEIANSRGLRMTDVPILREATLLARNAEDNKAGLIRAIRSGEMKSRLDYPLAANQMQLSALGLEAGTGLQGRGMQLGSNLAQQGILQNAQQFQADLRQRAFTNRIALTGQASGLGLGMAGIGGHMPNVPHGSSTSSSRGFGLAEAGSLMMGIGALAAFSDARVKDDYGVVAKTRSGLPLHVFHYKGERKDAPLRLGVMAQEAERLFPDAVTEDDRGIKIVDYKKVA